MEREDEDDAINLGFIDWMLAYPCFRTRFWREVRNLEEEKAMPYHECRETATSAGIQQG